jgi:hypothetical protein
MWLAWRHRLWLRADNHGWASMGYALLTLRRYGSTIRWMRDWRQRSDLKMWMLFNLSLALRARRRWNEAREVLRFAVKLPERDHTFQKLRLLLAMELALADGTEEAAAHFRELGTVGWDDYMRFRYRLIQGLLSIQQAAPAQRKDVFYFESVAIRKVLEQHRGSIFGADYRRSIVRMAKDTGSRWILVSKWLGM